MWWKLDRADRDRHDALLCPRQMQVDASRDMPISQSPANKLLLDAERL